MSDTRRDLGEYGQVDRSSPIPYYYQLQEILKQEIDNGRWKPGERLPSEAQLIETFGVSRTVVRKALDILEGDGQVYRESGVGTVVAQPKFRYEAVGTAADWGFGEHASPTLSRVVAIQKVPAGSHVGRLLQLGPGDDVFEVTFVQSIDDSPASLTQMFLRRDATPSLLATDLPQLAEGGEDLFLQLRANYDFEITESQVSIEATRTNSFEADLLDIRTDSPVFLLGSLAIGPNETPVAFSRSVVRSDNFRFSVVIRHTKDPTAPALGSPIRRERSWSSAPSSGDR